METKNSIGGNLGSTLTAIKTKGSKALYATARFLRWTIKPVVSIYSYFVSKSKSDAAQSRGEDTKLDLRNITVSDESNNTIDKKTTSRAEPRSSDVKASTTSNSTLVRQKSQEHLLEAKDEVSAAIRPHKIKKQEHKPEESVDGTIDLKTAVTTLLKKTAHADHYEILSQREAKLEELRAEIKKHPPNSELRRHAEHAYHNLVQFHKDEVVDYLEKSLRNVIRELLNRFPQISLEDARGVLTDYYQLIMLLPEGFLFDGYATHAAFRWLEIHFQRTRQIDEFNALKHDVARSVAHKIREELEPSHYQQLLKDMAQIHINYFSRCYDVWQSVLLPIIANGTSEQGSVHGHPRELISAKDKDLLLDSTKLLDRPDAKRALDLKRQLEQDAQKIKRKMGKLPDALRTLDLERVEQDFKQFELLQNTLTVEQQEQSPDFNELAARCETHRALIAQGRAALLDVQLNEGRRWDLKSFTKREGYAGDSKYSQQMFKKLIDLEHLRGPQVDLAQLDWIIAQNLKAQKHMNVAIEGAGPTGLMLALTQFQEGAVVSVFEKRSTEYNRVQVVRLDPKWMEMLKFYLGEHFYDMFGQDGQPGKGTIRSDGFGEIAIHRLEEGLNHRLTELMARNYEHSSQSSNRYRGRIERLAAYEMTDVIDSKGGFTVQAKYNPQYDPSPFANGKTLPPPDYQQPEKVVSRPVDLVICAGGKNSQIRNQYMKDRVVTNARNYGVCSWEGTKDQPIANGKLDTFPDFRGVVTFDQEFQKFFREQLKFQVDKIEGLSTEERQILNEQTSKESRNLFDLEVSTFRRAVQTRCFENKNLVYIGMELPKPFNQFCQNVKNPLAELPAPEFDQNGVQLSEEDQQKWRDQRAAKVEKAISKAWFQTVAHSYGLDSSLGVTEEKINDSFAATFPVQQHRLKKNVVEKQSGSHKVVFTAAGDAAASPHFMTASGLTGAREHALHLQNYTKKVSRQESPKADKKRRRSALSTLEKEQVKTGDFVIKRGEVFLGKQSYLKLLLGRYK